MQAKSLPLQIVEAIDGDDLESLQTLIAQNPEQLTSNTFFAGQTWLGYAAGKGKLDSIRMLINLGMRIDQGDHRENVKPICNAASNRRLDVVEHLIKLGAALDTGTSVQNPLFAAIVGRSPEITKVLLDAGIDCRVRYNTTTMNNMDAMAFALMRGESECANVIANWIARDDKASVSLLLQEADAIAEANAYERTRT